MIKIIIICEGLTEERFVKEILQPHFKVRDIILKAREIGGANRYPKIKQEIIIQLNADKNSYVSTMIDLYGMNNDFPGYTVASKNVGIAALQKVEDIETAILTDILTADRLYNKKFIPYIQLHEFEALLFSETQKLEDSLRLDNLALKENAFENIRNKFETPEHINDSRHTAPSKRIKNLVPAYDKITDGMKIAADIGLQKIREQCKHFNDWITALENLKTF